MILLIFNLEFVFPCYQVALSTCVVFIDGARNESDLYINFNISLIVNDGENIFNLCYTLFPTLVFSNSSYGKITINLNLGSINFTTLQRKTYTYLPYNFTDDDDEIGLRFQLSSLKYLDTLITTSIISVPDD